LLLCPPNKYALKEFSGTPAGPTVYVAMQFSFYLEIQPPSNILVQIPSVMHYHYQRRIFPQILLDVAEYLDDIVYIGLLSGLGSAPLGTSDFRFLVPIQPQQPVSVPVLLVVVNQSYVRRRSYYQVTLSELDIPGIAPNHFCLGITLYAGKLLNPIRLAVSRLYRFKNCLAFWVGRQTRLCL
jgi:hypothetical protein